MWAEKRGRVARVKLSTSSSNCVNIVVRRNRAITASLTGGSLRVPMLDRSGLRADWQSLDNVPTYTPERGR